MYTISVHQTVLEEINLVWRQIRWYNCSFSCSPMAAAAACTRRSCEWRSSSVALGTDGLTRVERVLLFVFRGLVAPGQFSHQRIPPLATFRWLPSGRGEQMLRCSAALLSAHVVMFYAETCTDKHAAARILTPCKINQKYVSTLQTLNE